MTEPLKLIAACLLALTMYTVGLSDGHEDACRLIMEDVK